MTKFQKLIIIILIMFVGISGFYLYRQEQIKKDELSFQEKELKLQENQRKIADCKYLLANQDLLLKFGKGKITLPEYEAYEEYESSAKKCRELLRNLPDSDIKF